MRIKPLAKYKASLLCLRLHFHLHNYCEILKQYIVRHQLPKTIIAYNILSIIARYSYYFNSPDSVYSFFG